jgi:DNA polymerase beta thumb
MRSSKRERIVKSTVSVPCASEADIFSALGLRYKEPEERCFFLSPATQKGSGPSPGAAGKERERDW